MEKHTKKLIHSLSGNEPQAEAVFLENNIFKQTSKRGAVACVDHKSVLGIFPGTTEVSIDSSSATPRHALGCARQLLHSFELILGN